ncbi:MAG: A/G-specific adenine glycosylase [Eubacterium sp.]|nr:A/G-specific adenine glycosylase [Eubacterium sp.]
MSKSAPILPIPDLAAALGIWYEENRRILPWREEPTPYHVWVSEIMLQQTRVEAVLGYYQRFLTELPTVASLAQCPEEKLLKLWEGLGYYNRVRNMQKCALLLCEEYGGRLPDSKEELQRLPGIGDYTAGAISSIAFGHAVSAIDGNALRILARLRMDNRDIAKAATRKAVGSEWERILNTCQAKKERNKAKAERNSPAVSKSLRVSDDKLLAPGKLNQALMDLGATVCLPNGAPECDRCPLGDFCKARKADKIFDYPVKSGTKQRRIEDRTILIVRNQDADAPLYAIEKRPEEGLLAGFYQFPNLEGKLTEDAAIKICEEHGAVPLHIEKLPPAKHIFSHIEWHMTAYEIRLAPFEMETTDRKTADKVAENKARKDITVKDKTPIDKTADDKAESTEQNEWFFYNLQEIKEKYPIPSAYAAYLKLLSRREPENESL